MRFLALLAISTALLAQQTQDEEFAKLVKQWTTKPEFLNPLVDHLPKAAGVPSPKDVIGHHVGEPNKLTYYSDIVRYFRALEKSSKRIKLFDAGKTDEGRESLVAMIADEATIASLNDYKAHLARLADPRGIDDVQAAAIIAKAKPIYMLTGGLHSAETGSPEMLMELAYRLIVEEGPMYDQIRKNVIVSIVPALEPDGQERYTDWYYRHKIHQKSEEDFIPGPPYWGKYIFHDNNRDMHYSQVVMRNWLKFYLDWHAPIVHDLHESVPFLYVFSGQPPHNPNLDPILYAELPFFANYDMAKLTSFGMPGVWTHAFVDMWSVGYLGFMASNHNGMVRMYETYGNGGANTMKRRIDGESAVPLTTRREWYRPSPPYKEVEWSLRNNTNYMQTGVLASLEAAAGNARMIVENFYRKSRNSVADGEKNAPYGWDIPAGQRDQTRVALLVNTLRLQGIEVGRKTDGGFLIRRDQPYGRLAKSLLEKQTYPEGGLRTYDDTGWTMGTQFMVDVKEVADKAALNVETTPVTTYEPRGTVSGADSGNARHLAIVHNSSNYLITLRSRLKDVEFEALDVASSNVASGDLPAGTLLTANTPRVRAEVEKLGLVARALDAMPNVARHRVDMPRIGMFSTWGFTQEVGWVRHAFDHFEIPYELIFKDRIRKGGLRGSYDAIVMPNQARGGAKGIVFDIDCRGKVLPYTRTSQYKFLGAYGETDDVCGGMGLEGVIELQKFVNEGGVLITLGGSSILPVDFGFIRRVNAGSPSATFYAPGPILEADIERASHPMFYGYAGKTIPIRYSNGPVFNASEADRKQWSLMKYPGTEKSVLSGHIRGVAELKDKPAILDIPTGKGRLLMFATNPCYRWQTHGEFNLLFNSLMHYNDIE